MNRTTARMAVTVAGVGALTGLAVGAAHADTPEDEGTGQTGSQSADGAAASEGPAQNYVLQGAPGLPIGDPVSQVFSVAAPAYGVLGALG